MSNCMILRECELDDVQVGIIRATGKEAMNIASDRYGSGFPDYKKGSIRKLGHNNGRHSRKVGDDTARLLDYLGFSTALQELGRTTGRAHDVLQLTGRGSDEWQSAEWIAARLRNTQILPAWTDKWAAKAILGTLPIFGEGCIIDQTANRLEFESVDEELFVKAVASADLGELYAPFGPYSSHMLFGQRQGLEPGDVPAMDNLLAFQTGQVAFVENYRYPLAQARKMFASHEYTVRRYTQFVYDQLVRKQITTWDQLISQDIAFMHDPYKVLARNHYGVIA
jgi:hypothetical protein